MACKSNNLDVDSESDEERYTKLEKLLSMQEKIKHLIGLEEELIEKKRKAKLEKMQDEKKLNSGAGCGKTEMNYEEILQLALKINQLPRNKLISVVHIIRSRESSLRHTDTDNFYVDFQQLIPSTLRRLKKFLEECEDF